MNKQEELEIRVHNLEVALIAYISVTMDLLPPNYIDGIDSIARELFDNSNLSMDKVLMMSVDNKED